MAGSAQGQEPVVRGWTQLTAINCAKLLTVALLLVLAAVVGMRGMRQVIYLSLHISYCLWWLLEQWLFPERRRQLFSERVGVAGFAGALLFIGVLYSLPGLLAFLNPAPISNAAVALALGLFSFGSLINTGADVQKTTAKALGAGLVSDGIWRRVRQTLDCENQRISIAITLLIVMLIPRASPVIL